MTNKESYSYYKTSYKANKKYRDKIGDDSYADMLSKKEYEAYREAGLPTIDIVYNQFHFYERDVAKKILKSIEQEGYKVSMRSIQSKQYSSEIYNAIKSRYHELTKGMSSTDAAALISYAFYGS